MWCTILFRYIALDIKLAVYKWAAINLINKHYNAGRWSSRATNVYLSFSVTVNSAHAAEGVKALWHQIRLFLCFNVAEVIKRISVCFQQRPLCCRGVLIPAAACRKHHFTVNIPRPERSAHLSRRSWMKSLFTARSHPASAIDADEISQRNLWCRLEDPTMVNSGHFIWRELIQTW